MVNIMICGDREMFLKAYEITLKNYLKIKSPDLEVEISIFAREDFNSLEDYFGEIKNVIDLTKKTIAVIDEIKFGGSSEVINGLAEKGVAIVYYCDYPQKSLIQESPKLRILLRYGLDPELLSDTVLELVELVND